MAGDYPFLVCQNLLLVRQNLVQLGLVCFDLDLVFDDDELVFFDTMLILKYGLLIGKKLRFVHGRSPSLYVSSGNSSPVKRTPGAVAESFTV